MRMFPRRLLRTVFVALSTTAVCTLVPATLSTPSAVAEPAPRGTEIEPEYPFQDNTDNRQPRDRENNRPRDREDNRLRDRDEFLDNNRLRDRDNFSDDSRSRERHEFLDRAEEAGAGVIVGVIDFSADIIKCGLHIATPIVECPL
uniref:hypothetical protein n=1 Tax=Nocardia donostiensis TaxID=1538463 RepID=UPI00111C0F59|nr:hypothetical protein [Nocardia donostiensis]